MWHMHKSATGPWAVVRTVHRALGHPPSPSPCHTVAWREGGGLRCAKANALASPACFFWQGPPLLRCYCIVFTPTGAFVLQRRQWNLTWPPSCRATVSDQ